MLFVFLQNILVDGRTEMTLLETLEYFLTETAADMDGLSWEIREETNFEDNNIDHLTECYDFNKQLYDNLKQIKSIIEEPENE